MKRIDPTINFEWKADKPAPEIRPQMFPARWQGWVKPKVSGVHTFFTSSDDGVRLWVNGQLLIDQWTVHAETEHSGQISLQADRKVEIKIEFFENAGSATIKLPGRRRAWPRDRPATQLYPHDLFDVHLDAVYGQLVAGGWVVLSVPEYQEVYQIESLTEDSRADFTLSVKTTRLTLKGEKLREKYNDRVRDTAIFAQNEELPMTGKPIDDPIEGDSVVLDRLLPDLQAPRTLIVSGKRMRVAVLSRVDLVAADGVSTVPRGSGRQPAARPDASDAADRRGSLDGDRQETVSPARRRSLPVM